MSEIACKGQVATVGFLTLCCALALINVVRALVLWNQSGAFFALGQMVFTFFAATAAWNIYQWKKVGWYLGLIVVLQWLSGIMNLGASVGWLSSYDSDGCGRNLAVSTFRSEDDLESRES